MLINSNYMTIYGNSQVGVKKILTNQIAGLKQ